MNAIRSLLISLVLLASATIGAAPLTPGLIVAISDGDTITLLTQDKNSPTSIVFFAVLQYLQHGTQLYATYPKELSTRSIPLYR